MTKHFGFLALVLCTTVAEGRTWTSDAGSYTVEADLVALGEGTVVLQRADKHLASVEVARLSQADRDYLATTEARLAAENMAQHRQTWTMRGGLKIVGQVVDFVARDVTIQRRRGSVYVNDRMLNNLPEAYQTIVPQVVAHFEANKVRDKRTLEAWLVNRRAAPVTYRCEGVILALENGDEYAIPFFLFSDEGQALLKPGWDDWLAMKGDYTKQQSMSDELQALAAAHQRDAEVTQQVAKLQLLLTAVDAGVTDLWEVTLYPGPGAAGPPLWVVAPGRDNLTATSFALGKNPGYVAGPVRRVSRGR
ncbi:MAG: SHD1 domain-containing protein [Lacipirellulaceae bacterium]